MVDGDGERSGSAVSIGEPVSPLLPRISEGALSIAKSASSIVRRESAAGSSRSIRSTQKSLGVAQSQKFPSEESSSLRKRGSELDAEEATISLADLNIEKPSGRKRTPKFARDYPELFRDDVSINPSYTGLRKFPYNVVCRRRFHENKSRINRQLNKEIENITMTQTFALDGVRVGRIFSVGFHPSQTIVKDFAAPRERVKNGYIKRVTDDEVKSLVLEIAGTNVATTFISCPQDAKKVLGIKLPFLIMIIKNMKKYFTFEITVLDDKNMHRRFRVSNFQSTTRVRPFCTTMPIGLSGGWNQIQFNLADFTRRAYGSNYIETTRMQIHANCRIRRIYYADRLYTEDEMPEEYKLFLPIHRRKSSREIRTSKTISKIDKLSENDRLPEDPPQFTTVPEGEELFRGLDSESKINPVDESVSEYKRTEEIGQRLSETRRRSDIDPPRSISSGKFEAKRKSVAVTIRDKSQDEIIDGYEEEAGIREGDEADEEENTIGEVAGENPDNHREELSDDRSYSQPVIQAEEISETPTNYEE